MEKKKRPRLSAREGNIEKLRERTVKSVKKKRLVEKKGEEARVAGAQSREKKSFSAVEMMKTLRHREKQCLTEDIKILNFNIEGLRTGHKKESLKAMAHYLQFNVAVITETHLLNNEAAALNIEGYKVVAKWGTSKHKGGVLILVDDNTRCLEVRDVQRPKVNIDICSVLLYPAGEESYKIRVTEIYIPPSVEARAKDLEPLVDPGCQSADLEGTHLSHVYVGDFNPNCWKGGSDSYQEWVMENGLWELSHPGEATFKTGSVLDKFILRIGKDIPEEWVLLDRSGDEAHLTNEEDAPWAAEDFYPAITFPTPWIADHHPQILSLKGCKKEEYKPYSSLKIGHLTEEAWQGKMH